jgi:hypothetical protein
MEGFAYNIKYRNTYRSGPKNRVLFSSLGCKFLDPRICFEKGKSLPGSGNPVNIKKELTGE